MRQTISSSLYNEHTVLGFLGWLAALAFGLAFLGVFGTVSYSVFQRTREYGVRLAVGASRRDVLLLILRSGMVTAAAGIALGLPLAYWGAAALRHSRYSVDSAVLPALAFTTLVVILANLAAVFVPAWRAARTNPMTALRYE
jgi:putative ABC transport system permease protein